MRDYDKFKEALRLLQPLTLRKSKIILDCITANPGISQLGIIMKTRLVQTDISHTVKTLFERGLIRQEKYGKYVHYFHVPERIQKINSVTKKFAQLEEVGYVEEVAA